MTSISIVTCKATEAMRARREALDASHRPAPSSLVGEGDFTRAGGAGATRLLLDRHPQVDGIFAASDLMAVGALHALRERPDSTPLLEGIRVPVLVVAGADDQITPAEGMREMASAIPDAEYVTVPEAGHLAPLEQPVAVNAAITAFLKKLG